MRPRPEPCVLFAQTFVHPHLDEYVDEVSFAEPVVITGCEFLEQNASLTSQSVTLLGATSPHSFALEVFVQYEGETRFRRLCQPFLYSHSSSNVLEVKGSIDIGDALEQPSTHYLPRLMSLQKCALAITDLVNEKNEGWMILAWNDGLISTGLGPLLCITGILLSLLDIYIY